MTKAAQLWPGDRMRAFFRAHIRRETTLDDAAAERLSEALTRAVNRMLVWDGSITETAAPSLRAKGKAAPAVAASAATPAKPLGFDPYAFSALVTFVKFGREALLKRLGEIATADNLRALAEAQHLGIDAKLKKPDDIRKAIVAATEQRLADRKAAAS